jgi:hypothetical protein
MATPLSPGQFNESMYRAFYNDLDVLVGEGKTYPTAFDHYLAIGQFLVPAKKEAFYTGTNGDDTVTGIGADIDLYGVDIKATFTSGSGPNSRTTPANFKPQSFGVGEKDTLVGRDDEALEDGFFLSVVNGDYSRTGGTSGMTFGTSSRLYVGQGDQDFARAKNFNIGLDYVSLSGGAKDYIYRYKADSLAPGGYSLNILTKKERDLVGVVEGIKDFQPRNFLADGSFRLSGRVPTRGFNDAVYDLTSLGGATGGLENYVKFGQAKGLTGVFSGAAAGSPTLNSTTAATGSDTVIAYGKKTLISGVELSVVNGVVEAGTGAGQKDVLVGSLDGVDEFLLGFAPSSKATGSARSFYLGGGVNDFATIQNYESRDRVLVAGDAKDYAFKSIDGNIEISKGGDLIAKVEGAAALLKSTKIKVTAIGGGKMSSLSFDTFDDRMIREVISGKSGKIKNACIDLQKEVRSAFAKPQTDYGLTKATPTKTDLCAPVNFGYGDSLNLSSDLFGSSGFINNFCTELQPKKG